MSSLDVRAVDETDLRQTPRPITKHELTVFLSETAFDRAVARGDSDTTREIGGVLVGELRRDESGPYLAIETTIDALHAEEKGAELTFTHATWEHIHKEMDTTHKGKKVVGWYHTHPGFGVFLSDRDQFIHKSFFNLPFQVAFVYDPKSKEHGMFAWRDNEVWRLRRYAIGARDHTWDGNRNPAAPADKVDKVDKAEPERRSPRASESVDDGLGIGGSLGTFAMIAVVLMLIAGFVGHWLGASSTNAVLAQAQIEIAKARGEGAQLAIASLQNELVGLLRATIGDQAVHKPVAEAARELDGSIASLVALRPPAATPVPGAPVAPPTPADPNIEAAITRLVAAREAFVRLAQDRSSAEATLAAISQMTRHGSDLRADLARDVAEQRAGLGTLYAELAKELERSDPGRAARLLAAAAHLDPGNRGRYEAQLRKFEPKASLPRDANPVVKPPVPTGQGGTP